MRVKLKSDITRYTVFFQVSWVNVIEAQIFTFIQ